MRGLPCGRTFISVRASQRSNGERIILPNLAIGKAHARMLIPARKPFIYLRGRSSFDDRRGGVCTYLFFRAVRATYTSRRSPFSGSIVNDLTVIAEPFKYLAAGDARFSQLLPG